MNAQNPSSLPFVIDSDNALGSPFGDVDDAFAIAAMLKSSTRVKAIHSVFGNSFESLVYQNHLALASLCGYEGDVHHGAAKPRSGPTEASRHLAACTEPLRILSIGPLSNIARALVDNPNFPAQVRELIFVGANFHIPLPALRFFDFNQSKDPKAMRGVFDSNLPLTCVPCNIARRLRVTEKDLQDLGGRLGEHLRVNSRRWFLRARLLKGSAAVPLWDLVASLYVLRPELFTVLETRAVLGRFGDVSFGLGTGRPVKLVIDYDPQEIWKAFLALWKA